MSKFFVLKNIFIFGKKDGFAEKMVFLIDETEETKITQQKVNSISNSYFIKI